MLCLSPPLQERAAGKKITRGVLKTPTRTAADVSDEEMEEGEPKAAEGATTAGKAKRGSGTGAGRRKGSRIRFAADVEEPASQEEQPASVAAARGKGSRGGVTAAAGAAAAGAAAAAAKRGSSDGGWISKQSPQAKKQQQQQRPKQQQQRRQQQQERSDEDIEDAVEEEEAPPLTHWGWNGGCRWRVRLGGWLP